MAAAEDEVRSGGRVPPPHTFPLFFPFEPRHPFPRASAPESGAFLARRSRATSKSCVAIAIDARTDPSLFRARAVARARSRRGRGASPVEGNEFFSALEPLD